VCGLGNVGFRVVAELVREGERVVAIERARDNHFISTARRLGVAVIVGDATVMEVLGQAHAASAKAVVAATSNELVNLEVGLLVRQLDPSQRVVLRVSDPNLARTLREAAKIRLSLSISELAAPAFIAALIGDRVRSVFLIEGQLLAAIDLVVQPLDNFFENMSVRVLAIDYRLLPICLLDAANRSKENLQEACLQSGDRLTAIIGLKDLQRLLKREKAPREWVIDVISCPEEARPVLAKLGIETSLGHLTRGEAEQLLTQVRRAHVSARIRQGEPGA
jgi:Trk K+ transport system NAD-binding subunit